jgi:hypothetical protein
MEKETIEEALNSEIKLVHDVVRNKDFDLGFQTGGIFGAKWQAERMGLMEIELNHTKTLLASCEKALEDRDKQAERMYSEEDMINFANFKINNLMKHVDKTGFYLGTNKVLEIWKEEFKNK